MPYVVPEIKNTITEIMKYQHTALTKIMLDSFIKQEAERVNLARTQFNQRIEGFRSQLLTELNNYIVRRQGYKLLKLRQWYYGKVAIADNQQQSYKAVFSKSSSDLYSLAKYERAFAVINEIHDYTSALHAYEKLSQLAKEIQPYSSTLAYYIQSICIYIEQLNKNLIAKTKFPQLNNAIESGVQKKQNEIDVFIVEYFNKQLKAIEGIPPDYIEHLRNIEKIAEQLRQAEFELEKCPRKTYDVLYDEAYDDFDYGAWGNSDIQSPEQQAEKAQRQYQQQEKAYQTALQEAKHRNALLTHAQSLAQKYAEEKKLAPHLIAACTHKPVMLADNAILELLVGEGVYHQILENMKNELNIQFGSQNLNAVDHKIARVPILASAPSAFLVGLSQQKLFGTTPPSMPINNQKAVIGVPGVKQLSPAPN